MLTLHSSVGLLVETSHEASCFRAGCNPVGVDAAKTLCSLKDRELKKKNNKQLHVKVGALRLKLLFVA